MYKVWTKHAAKPILTKNLKILENSFSPKDWYRSRISESSENTDLEHVDYKHDSETEPEVVKDNSSNSARGNVTENQLHSLTN